ncbi:MAG: hypothetical protein Q7R81_01680 [Candidatus Peregrinibacteria bacterium]|nr:hypothetical protein [Candidatus Peregrinibacteria bacterium]
MPESNSPSLERGFELIASYDGYHPRTNDHGGISSPARVHGVLQQVVRLLEPHGVPQQLGEKMVGVDVWEGDSKAIAETIRRECARLDLPVIIAVRVVGGTPSTPVHPTIAALYDSPEYRAKKQEVDALNLPKPQADQIRDASIYEHLPKHVPPPREPHHEAWGL